MRSDIYHDILYEINLLDALEKRILSSPPAGISIDSRQIKQGDIFVALKGGRVDGSSFIPDALSKGAQFIITSDRGSIPLIKEDISYILVNDPVYSIQHLAMIFLQRFQSSRKAVITGSAGKTTVKEMAGSILNAAEKPCFINARNYNSQVGIPLSILSIKGEPEIMVFEIGMSCRGEIKRLAEIIGPDTALVLNIGDVHREFFSSIYEIRDAKLEFIDFMRKDPVIIYFSDDKVLSEGIREKWNKRTIRYSLKGKYSIKPARYDCDEMGFYTFSMLLPSGYPVVDIRLRVPGLHNLINAVSAACLCDCLGIEPRFIAMGLGSCSAVSMRSNLYARGGYIIYEDCYNSSPIALKNALDAFSGIRKEGKSLAVLGDMLELGTESARYHDEMLSYALDRDIDAIITVGKEFWNARDNICPELKKRVSSFIEKEDAGGEIIKRLKDHKKIFIKGSRSIQLEKILQVIENNIFDDNK